MLIIHSGTVTRNIPTNHHLTQHSVQAFHADGVLLSDIVLAECLDIAGVFDFEKAGKSQKITKNF
jgi:hypothetical protein